MDITLNTPALLFPAISLILLAYTNRFNTITELIRRLHTQWQETKDVGIHRQVQNLGLRTRLIRDMQGLGVIAMFLCVLCMALIYAGRQQAATWVFGTTLLVLMASLVLSLWEIWISTNAIQLELADMEAHAPRRRRYLLFGPREKRSSLKSASPAHEDDSPPPTFAP